MLRMRIIYFTYVVGKRVQHYTQAQRWFIEFNAKMLFIEIMA